jgi:hypothetical protein
MGVQAHTNFTAFEVLDIFIDEAYFLVDVPGRSSSVMMASTMSAEWARGAGGRACARNVDVFSLISRPGSFRRTHVYVSTVSRVMHRKVSRPGSFGRTHVYVSTVSRVMHRKVSRPGGFGRTHVSIRMVKGN